MSAKGNCKDSVLKYLVAQNRPFSANDVVLNLHQEFGKTAVQKALEDLVVENKVREKVYGKQKVYSVVQDETFRPEEMGEELSKLDSKIQEVSEKLSGLQQKLKENEMSLKNLENQLTTEQALIEKKELDGSVRTLKEKIQVLSKSTVKISEAERNKIQKDCEKYTKEYRKRKRICMEIVNSILENYPKKMKVLFEEIGIEIGESDNITVK